MLKIDLLIQNGLILTYDEKPTIGNIAIDKGKIIEFGNLSDKFEPLQIIDASNKIVMPGFVNTHTHAAMSYFKGMADDQPLMEWLSKHIWPVEKKFLAEEFVQDSTLHGCAEMIKNGITTFNDMYFFGDQTAGSAQKAGIRAVLGEGVLDYPVANYQNPNEIFAYITEMNSKYENNDMIDFAVAPHAIYTCGKENLIKAKELANKLDLLLHIHLSETKQEVEDCSKIHGKRPVEYLNSLGFFEGKTLAAHAIWLDENEQNILADTGTSIAINTSSNLKLVSGFNSFADYLKKGINLSIGTDGVASNNNLSMLEEISTTSKLHKALSNDPTIFPADQMVKMATLGGAKALGKVEDTGSIQVAKNADLICVDINNIQSQPLYSPFSHLVYTLSSENITDSIINGKIVMKDRELVNVDEAELIEKAKYYQQKIIDFRNI